MLFLLFLGQFSSFSGRSEVSLSVSNRLISVDLGLSEVVLCDNQVGHF